MLRRWLNQGGRDGPGMQSAWKPRNKRVVLIETHRGKRLCERRTHACFGCVWSFHRLPGFKNKLIYMEIRRTFFIFFLCEHKSHSVLCLYMVLYKTFTAKPGRRWKGSIKMDWSVWESTDWVHRVLGYGPVIGYFEHDHELLNSIQYGEFINLLRNWQLVKDCASLY